MNHRINDEIGLALGRRVAAELPKRAEWIERARSNIRRWRERNADSPGLLRCYAEWEKILERPVEEVCAILTDPSDEGQRLRQSTPFSGTLSPQEVWRIKQAVRDEQSAA